jgi:hypothetical protein
MRRQRASKGRTTAKLMKVFVSQLAEYPPHLPRQYFTPDLRGGGNNDGI